MNPGIWQALGAGLSYLADDPARKRKMADAELAARQMELQRQQLLLALAPEEAERERLTFERTEEDRQRKELESWRDAYGGQSVAPPSILGRAEKFGFPAEDLTTGGVESVPATTGQAPGSIEDIIGGSFPEAITGKTLEPSQISKASLQAQKLQSDYYRDLMKNQGATERTQITAGASVKRAEITAAQRDRFTAAMQPYRDKIAAASMLSAQARSRGVDAQTQAIYQRGIQAAATDLTRGINDLMDFEASVMGSPYISAGEKSSRVTEIRQDIADARQTLEDLKTPTQAPAAPSVMPRSERTVTPPTTSGGLTFADLRAKHQESLAAAGGNVQAIMDHTNKLVEQWKAKFLANPNDQIARQNLLAVRTYQKWLSNPQ